MNNIRKALRYIYIYILTHWNAGWEYDLQSREVWKERAKASVSKRIRICDLLLVHAKWEICNGKQRYKRPDFGRCWNHFRVAGIERKVSNQRNKHKFRQELAGFTSSRCLTSKEVAA